ncbi:MULTISPECIES: Imm21 family immunity protein [unclassified Streptomyces]|uniref:Imm21 family immunity protein n=1 Tax=unclassified Streptomyces TaxID=2593676 RepID=UPI0032459F1F
MVRYAVPGAVEWIESGGGPLIVIPEASLSAWRGADGDDWDDYDRACGVDGHVGLIAVGQSHALVLGFDPASTAFLPSAGAFVRWIAADSEDELLGSVDAALASAVWEETVMWDVPGPVVLFDSAWPGGEAHEDERLRVEVAAGRYRVQAAQVTPRPSITFCLVQLVPVT